MGLCGEIGSTDKKNIYGDMTYVAPEVLRGNPYTQAADIYSFGMVMYFVATGRQPFANCAHDQCLALKICNGIRPEINEPEAPKCYIDLMKKCWDSNPNKRPNTNEVYKLVGLFYNDISDFKFNMISKKTQYKSEFEKAENYRKANTSSIENIQSTTHSQAIYTSRILNPFIEDLSRIL